MPAIAVSLRRTRDYVFDFGPSARGGGACSPSWCCGIRCRSARFSTSTCPKGTPKGFRRTVQGKRNHVTKIAERLDPRGKPYYWIEEGIDEWAPHDRSDYHAVKEGYISVSLLHPDLTAHSARRRPRAVSAADRASRPAEPVVGRVHRSLHPPSSTRRGAG